MAEQETTISTGLPAGCVAEGVRDEIAEELTKTPLVSDDRARGRRLAGHRAGGIDGAGVLGGVAGERGEVDPVSFQRASLVEAGEQQQVVDEPGHARRLAVDPAHGRVEIGGAVGQAVLEQLRIAPDRGERGPQLVGGVRHEAPEASLGGLPFPKGGLDAAQHDVERAAEPAHLGMVVGLLDAPAQVARRDLPGGLGHLLERPQPDPDGQPGGGRERDEDRAADEHLECQQAMSRAGDPVERDRDDEQRVELPQEQACTAWAKSRKRVPEVPGTVVMRDCPTVRTDFSRVPSGTTGTPPLHPAVAGSCL